VTLAGLAWTCLIIVFADSALLGEPAEPALGHWLPVLSLWLLPLVASGALFWAPRIAGLLYLLTAGLCLAVNAAFVLPWPGLFVLSYLVAAAAAFAAARPAQGNG